MSLNHYQRLFLGYYLNEAKDDAVKAARMAGYHNPDRVGPRLLNSKAICSELEKKMEEAGVLPVAEILARLSTIATMDPMEFVEFKGDENKDGTVVEKTAISLKRIKKLRKGHLIKDLKIHPSGAVEIKFQDSVEAMDKLAKYHGIFKERIEISHVGGDASDHRFLAVFGGFLQLAGKASDRAAGGEVEPGALCDSGEQWEVGPGPALDADQSVIDVGGPEGD